MTRVKGVESKKLRPQVKTILKWASNIVIALLVILVILSIFSNIKAKKNPGKVPSILGFKPMSVLSGSMEPTISVGDMIVAREVDPNAIKTGDIITYRIDEHTRVTHRVVDIIKKDNGLFFKTKGDANNIEDNSLVPDSKLVGKLFFNIPKGGYIANFIRTPKGMILVIFIPLILILGGELIKAIKKEDKKKD